MSTVAGALSFSGLAANVQERVSTPPNEAGDREARGGGWSSQNDDELRANRRTWPPPDERSDDIGGRCALDGAALSVR